MVPSLMVLDIKHDATNQVLALLSKYDIGRKVREVQEYLDVECDGFPHRNQLAYGMVAN